MTETPRTDTGPSAGPDRPAGAPTAPRPLRRSKDDRVGAGVAGGLGKFFGVDPIIFRVLFVALTFMGLAGVVAYLLCYAVIPEEGAVNSKLDRAIAAMRQRGVPIWVGIVVALGISWLFVFSWWSPVPFVPLAVVAVILALGISRLRPAQEHTANPVQPPPMHPAPMRPPSSSPDWAGSDDDEPTVSLLKDGGNTGGVAGASPTAALADLDAPWTGSTPPGPVPESSAVPSASAQLREWWSETQVASKQRGRRGWVTEAVAYALLGTVWLVLALVSLGSPIPVQAFLWTGFGVIFGCTLIGALVRRPRWRMLVGVGFITALILLVGTYPVRIGDPTGQLETRPTSVSEIKGAYRMFGGEQILDLRSVDFSDRTAGTHITQGAGHVKVMVPGDVDIVLDAKARYGEVRAFGNSTGGLHNRLEETNLGDDGLGGGTLRLTIDLLAGQIDIVRS